MSSIYTPVKLFAQNLANADKDYGMNVHAEPFFTTQWRKTKSGGKYFPTISNFFPII